MKIKIKILSENSTREIDGLKILSEEKLNIAHRVSLKNGCLFYPIGLLKEGTKHYFCFKRW